MDGPTLPFRIFKRLVDFALAAPFALVACLCFPIIFMANRISGDRGPTLFHQERVGRHGELIKVAKYRSMRVDAEQYLYNDAALWQRYVDNGFKLLPEEDVRITKVGNFFRKYSIDELPQFWNILGGTMSCVGPRPLVPKEVEFLLANPEHREAYYSVKPGITGLWQISGRSTVTGDDRALLDYTYVKNMGFALDLSILVRTPIAIIKAHGAR